MFKKSLISITLAALLACSALVGCSSAADSSSASSSSASSSSSAAASSSAAETQGTVNASVRIDVALLDGTAEAESLLPYDEPESFEFAEGDTAYDALVATGVEVDGTPSYVTSINGVGEGLAGSASGWMYMVNDEIPDVAANEYVLEDGDEVIWYYGSWE